MPNEYGYYDPIEAGLRERIYEGGEPFSVILAAETTQRDPEVTLLSLKGAYNIFKGSTIDLSPKRGALNHTPRTRSPDVTVVGSTCPRYRGMQEVQAAAGGGPDTLRAATRSDPNLGVGDPIKRALAERLKKGGMKFALVLHADTS